MTLPRADFRWPTELPEARPPVWLVCETDHRWLRLLGRSMPDLCSASAQADRRLVTPSLRAATVVDVFREASTVNLAVVWWEIERAELAEAIGRVGRLAAVAPQVVQLAGGNLHDREWLLLLEVGLTGFLRRPEEVMRLRPLVTATFARLTERLD